MKLKPVANLDKKQFISSKNFDNDVMSVNYYIILNFHIFTEFGASGFRQMVYDLLVFIYTNLISNNNENRTKK